MVNQSITEVQLQINHQAKQKSKITVHKMDYMSKLTLSKL